MRWGLGALGVALAGVLLVGCADGGPSPVNRQTPGPAPRTSANGRVVEQGPGCFSYVVPGRWQLVDHVMGGEAVYYAVNPEKSRDVASRCTRHAAPRSIAALARGTMRDDLAGSHAHRLADVRLDGVRAYHVRGRRNEVTSDYLGLQHGDVRVLLWFNVNGPPRRALVRSVVTSWRWNR